MAIVVSISLLNTTEIYIFLIFFVEAPLKIYNTMDTGWDAAL